MLENPVYICQLDILWLSISLSPKDIFSGFSPLFSLLFFIQRTNAIKNQTKNTYLIHNPETERYNQ